MTPSPPANVATAVEMALVQGLLQRTKTGEVIHCPLMLSPTPLPNALMAQMRSLIQPSCLLAHRVANNLDFLAEQLRLAAETDDYTHFLLSLALEEERNDQSLRFAIARSDYFVTQTGNTGSQLLRQVEFNTIAASYIGLSGQIAKFHQTWRTICNETWDLIPNDPANDVADAFVAAFEAYGVADACVLFVVQPNERNIFDQRILEVALVERNIQVFRITLEELSDQSQLRNGHLVFNGQIVAITYFRAGYTPQDLQSEPARQARKLIARSTTISVPDLATHLAGTKKIQQVLTSPHLLRTFLKEDDATLLENSFARIVTLDDSIEIDDKQVLASEAAIANPDRFVLKPQREGGGFNLYGEDIRTHLSTISAKERHRYILMERLYPPVHQAQGIRDGQLWQDEVVSEIGQFGIFLARNDEILLNRGSGYLVRTKKRNANEGGISSGSGHLNSLARLDPALVNRK